MAPVMPAEAGLLEFFFPSLRQKGPDPLDTLQAPFALDPQAKPPAQKPDPAKAVLPENTTPVDQPHRGYEEISAWLTNILSETMTFDSSNYQPVIAKNAQYFTAAGKDEYVSFLNENNVLKVLDSKKYQVKTFVENTPLLLNEGAVNGVYRWLYEVPVMISYMPAGAKDYKKLQPVNQRVVLTIQAGRVPGQLSGTGLLLERWSGRLQANSPR